MTTPPTPSTSTDHASRFQFSLKQMFLALLAVCLVLGMNTWIGGLLTVLIVAFLVETLLVVKWIRTKTLTLLELLAFLTVLGLLGFLLAMLLEALALLSSLKVT